MAGMKTYRCGHRVAGEWTESGLCPSCVERDRRRRQKDDDYLANSGYPLDLGFNNPIIDSPSIPDSSGDSTPGPDFGGGGGFDGAGSGGDF